MLSALSVCAASAPVPARRCPQGSRPPLGVKCRPPSRFTHGCQPDSSLESIVTQQMPQLCQATARYWTATAPALERSGCRKLSMPCRTLTLPLPNPHSSKTASPRSSYDSNKSRGQPWSLSFHHLKSNRPLQSPIGSNPIYLPAVTPLPVSMAIRAVASNCPTSQSVLPAAQGWMQKTEIVTWFPRWFPPHLG